MSTSRQPIGSPLGGEDGQLRDDQILPPPSEGETEALAVRLETLAARLETDHAPYWDRQAAACRGPDAALGYYNRVDESLSGAKDLRQAASRLRSQGSE